MPAALAAATLLAAAALLAVPAADASWLPPRTVLPAQALDIGPLALTGDVSGSALLGVNAGEGDLPGDSAASLVTGGATGRFSRRREIGGAKAVLAGAYLSRRPVVLLGSAPARVACCTTVSTLAPGPGLRAGRPVLTGLGGAAEARLVRDGQRLLAVVATDRGVWAALSSADGRRFGAPRRLSPADESPQSIAVTAQIGGGATVAWTARLGGLTAPGPTEIVVARAKSGRLPGRARVALRTASDHAVDEVALGSARVPELVWVESEIDRSGRFRSVVRAAALGSRHVPGRLISGVGSQAGDLAVAGRPGGPLIAVWRACDASGTCRAQAALATTAPGPSTVPRARVLPPPPRFSASRTLGLVDSSQAPAAAVSAAGVPFAAWIGAGAVRSVAAPAGRLGRPWTIARSAYASGVTLAGAGRDGMLAAWVEGTARERVRVAGWRR